MSASRYGEEIELGGEEVADDPSDPILKRRQQDSETPRYRSSQLARLGAHSRKNELVPQIDQLVGLNEAANIILVASRKTAGILGGVVGDLQGRIGEQDRSNGYVEAVTNTLVTL